MEKKPGMGKLNELTIAWPSRVKQLVWVSAGLSRSILFLEAEGTNPD